MKLDPFAELSLSRLQRSTPFHFNRDNTVTKCILIDSKRGYTTRKKTNTPLDTYKSIGWSSATVERGAKYLLTLIRAEEGRENLFAKKRGRKKLGGWSRLSKGTRRRRGMTSTREAKEKIGWTGGAIRRDGDHVAPSRFVIKPCLGSTKVILDFEYIDSVHHNERGVMTGGTILAVSLSNACHVCFGFERCHMA